jgi:hypothetical protein
MPPFFLLQPTLAMAFFLFFLLNLPFGKTNASSSHLSRRNFFGIWPWVFAESRAETPRMIGVKAWSEPKLLAKIISLGVR